MPLATLYLVSLTPSTTLKTFLTHVQASSLQPLVISRVIRWIIRPSVIDVDPLLHPPSPWHLLLILPSTTPLPSTLTPLIANTFITTVGIPSRLTTNFSARNASILHPTSTPSLTQPFPLTHPDHMGSTSQTLELSPDLAKWIESFATTSTGQAPMSMLNFLSFLPDKKESYLTYGKAFAQTIGAKRGGDAKLVGHVVYPSAHSEAAGASAGTPANASTHADPVPTASGTGALDFDAVKGTSAKASATASANPPTHADPVPTASGTGALDFDAVPDHAPPKASGQGSGEGQGAKWDEFALAHYPSIMHFAEMLASKDYQEVNLKYRVPSLRDTCILCTSEIEIEEILKGGVGGGAGGREAKL